MYVKNCHHLIVSFVPGEKFLSAGAPSTPAEPNEFWKPQFINPV
jgi:hypothetical protein